MTRARSLSQLANSNVFSADATNNRVGIGSTLPTVKLDVGGDMNVQGTLTYEDVTNVETTGIITAAQLVVTGVGATFAGISTFLGDIQVGDKIIHNGDTNTAIRFPAADTFTVETGGSEALRITSAGLVGINTETPTTVFDVQVNTLAGINFTNQGQSPLLDFRANNVESAGRIRVGENSGGAEMLFLTKTTGGTLTEAFRADTSQRLLIGTTSSRGGNFNNSSGVDAQLQIEGTSFKTSFANIVRNSNDENPAAFAISKSRGTSAGSNVIVQDNDNVGRFAFQGSDGSKMVHAADIECEIDGTPGSADMPGRLIFSTNAGGTGTTERLRITSDGRIGINETSPDQLLHIKNNASAGYSASIKLESSGTSNSANDTMGLIQFAHNDSNDAGVSASIVCRAEDAAGNTYLQVNNGNPSASSERLRITSGGLVGINCTPLAQLQVKAGTNANIALTTMSSEAAIEVFNDAGNANVPFRLRATEHKFFISSNEKLRIDSSGRLKIGTISDYSSGVTNAPVYIAMQSDITGIGDDEGDTTAGMVRLEETGSNDGRLHGIELRNKNSGDIRFFNQDQSTLDRGDLLLIMPDEDASDGTHLKMRVNSLKSSIQISGKGGAVAGNAQENHTDIYIATKTGMTAVNTGLGNEVAGLIRFEDKGSNNNRYHGIEIRNRNSGDARILNLDEGTTNKANLVFAVDTGSTLEEVMRLTSTGALQIGSSGPGSLTNNVRYESLRIGSGLVKKYYVIDTLDNGQKTRFTFTGTNRTSAIITIMASGSWTASNTANNHPAAQFISRVMTNSSGDSVDSSTVTTPFAYTYSTSNYTFTNSGSFGYTIDIANPTGDSGVTFSYEVTVQSAVSSSTHTLASTSTV